MGLRFTCVVEFGSWRSGRSWRILHEPGQLAAAAGGEHATSEHIERSAVGTDGRLTPGGEGGRTSTSPARPRLTPRGRSWPPAMPMRRRWRSSDIVGFGARAAGGRLADVVRTPALRRRHRARLRGCRARPRRGLPRHPAGQHDGRGEPPDLAGCASRSKPTPSPRNDAGPAHPRARRRARSVDRATCRRALIDRRSACGTRSAAALSGREDCAARSAGATTSSRPMRRRSKPTISSAGPWARRVEQAEA